MSLKASELRIGNKIQWQDMDFEVVAIEADSITPMVSCDYDPRWPKYHLEGVPLKEFKPIPLSEEWLVKFGFGGTSFFSNPDFLFTLKKYSNCFTLLVSDDVDYEEPIESVHRLQNIFHSLTGKELTIKNESH